MLCSAIINSFESGQQQKPSLPLLYQTVPLTKSPFIDNLVTDTELSICSSRCYAICGHRKSWH